LRRSGTRQQHVLKSFCLSVELVHQWVEQVTVFDKIVDTPEGIVSPYSHPARKSREGARIQIFFPDAE